MIFYKRLIYTAGTIKFTDALRYCRRILITSDVLRFPPQTVYASEKTNPPNYFLGYATLWIDSYVVKKIPIEFSEQIIFHWDNLEFQNYISLGCFSALQVDNLVALRESIPLPGALVKVSPPLGDFPGMPYSHMKFKLPLGTRLQISAIGEEQVVCDDFTPPARLPELPDLIDRYPLERPRIEDPARDEPYDDELPGDTALATDEDPDSGMVALPVTLSVLYNIGAANGFPSGGNVTVEYEVPDTSYTVELVAGTAPSICSGQQPQRSVAKSPGKADIIVANHNTCNALTILSQTYI